MSVVAESRIIARVSPHRPRVVDQSRRESSWKGRNDSATLTPRYSATAEVTAATIAATTIANAINTLNLVLYNSISRLETRSRAILRLTKIIKETKRNKVARLTP